jgi:type IV pilus assembly protein PilX
LQAGAITGDVPKELNMRYAKSQMNHRCKIGYVAPSTPGVQPDNAGHQCRIRCGAPHRQQGIVLVVSLVILMILTILGMAAMSTSSLEIKMSGNAQETTRALEAAESGLNKLYNDTSSFNTSNLPKAVPYTYGVTNVVTASVSVNFIEYSTPVRGSGYSATNSQVANFDEVSEGKTATALGGRAVVHQGLGQVGSAGN